MIEICLINSRSFVPIHQRLDLTDELELSVVIEVKTSDSLAESVRQLRKRSSPN